MDCMVNLFRESIAANLSRNDLQKKIQTLFKEKRYRKQSNKVVSFCGLINNEQNVQGSDTTADAPRL